MHMGKKSDYNGFGGTKLFLKNISSLTGLDIYGCQVGYKYFVPNGTGFGVNQSYLEMIFIYL